MPFLPKQELALPQALAWRIRLTVQRRSPLQRASYPSDRYSTHTLANCLQSKAAMSLDTLTTNCC